MNAWGRDDLNDVSATSGPGGALLLMGIALGAAAAYLLGTKPGQQLGKQVAERAGDWTAQAADAIARGRESLIASVEQQKDGDSGPVREMSL